MASQKKALCTYFKRPAQPRWGRSVCNVSIPDACRLRILHAWLF